MRTRPLRFFLLGLVLSLFFLTTPVSAADVGISAAGPLLNASFDVVPGQAIGSTLFLTNTGESPANITSYVSVSSGVLGSISHANPPLFDAVAPESTVRADFNFTVLENATDVVTLTIGCIAVHDFGNGSAAFAGIETRVRFIINPNPLRLKVRVLDQWGWPVDGYEVGLWRESLEYVRQSVNETGMTGFLLSRGLYRLTLFRSDSDQLIDDATLNISSDRLFEFHVFRGLSPSQPPMIPLVEVGLGFILGYIYRAVQRKKRSRPKSKDELQEWLEWSKSPLS